MTQQIPLDSRNRAEEIDRNDDTREIAADLAYLRTVMVNVVFFGLPNAGDRKWVLIDAGIMGAKTAIKSAAEKRFGADARPAAIILTHGHFDHVGALEGLVGDPVAVLSRSPFCGTLQGTRAGHASVTR